MSNNTRLAELMNYITIDTTSGNQFQMSGSIKQTSVTSALLKASATGVLTAATAGTDYLTSVGISNLTATGAPSSTTYLRGDNTWATVSGGASSVSTLTDVVITSVANGDVLQYNSSTSKWVNAVVSSGGVTLDTTQTITGTKTFQAQTYFKGTSTIDTLTFGTTILNSTGWSALPANWSGDFTTGYTISAGGGTLSKTQTVAAGSYVKVSITAVVTTSSTFYVYVGNAAYFSVATGTNTYVLYVPCPTITTTIQLQAGAALVGTISNILIQPVSNTISPVVTFSGSSGASNVLEFRVPLTSGYSSIYIGNQSGLNTHTGTKNIGLGEYSLNRINTGASNIAIGVSAMYNSQTTSGNVSIGSEAAYSLYNGSNNTVVGNIAMRQNQSVNYNTIIGSQSLYTTIYSEHNALLGYNTLYALTSGGYNCVIGSDGGSSLTTASYNVIIGYQASKYISGGSTVATNVTNSIIIGYNAFPLANTQSNQIVIGYQTVGFGSNTTTIGNSSTVDSVIYGNLVLGSTSTGVGYKLNVTGTTIHNNTSAMDTGVVLGANQLTSSGWGTLPANWSGSFAGGYVITAGGGTLTNTLSLPQYSFFTATITANVTTTGTLDIYCGGTSGDAYWGSSSLPVGTTTSSKTSFTTTTGTTSIVASSTLVATISNIQIQLVTGVITPNVTFNSSGGNNKIEIRLDNIVGASSQTNTFIGTNSGAKNYTGQGNLGFGGGSLAELLTGIGNVAIGGGSQALSKTGNGNTTVGYQSFFSSYSGNNNVAIGYTSLYTLNGASWNVAVGRESLYSLVTGSNNTAIGDVALRGLGAASSNNVGIGESAGRYITSGGNNVIIGEGAGQSAAVTVNNSILIGQGTTFNATGQTNQIVIGYASAGLGSNTTVIGNASTTLTALYGTVITGGTSANAAAQLQVDSTTKGVLFPRMTTTQKNAIATPPAGLVVYDTDLAKLCVFTTAWQTITSA